MAAAAAAEAEAGSPPAPPPRVAAPGPCQPGVRRGVSGGAAQRDLRDKEPVRHGGVDARRKADLLGVPAGIGYRVIDAR